VGMTPGEMEKIFDRFSQANSRISSTYGGSGLGLSLSKQLVSLMRGELSVESEKGKGSTFTFYIPCERIAEVREDSTLPQPPLMYKPPQQESTHLDRKVNVLIVEDNHINQKLLMNLLSRKSYLYEVANNGQEAVEKFANGQFDLVFMDLQMPVMDGITAARKIRELEAQRRANLAPPSSSSSTSTSSSPSPSPSSLAPSPSASLLAPPSASSSQEPSKRSLSADPRRITPIIALTGNARESRVQDALSAGMNGYLTKPYDWQRIYDLIHHYVFEGERPSSGAS